MKVKETPSQDWLFKLREEEQEKLLPQEKVCKRVRPEIQTAIAFLTTQVCKPDQDDQKKLKRVLEY